MIYVIVPIFNGEKFLSRCIESVLNQTFSDFKLICVNDGSTDNTSKILESYKKKDNRIFVINKTNGGVSSARNSGIKFIDCYSNNDFICFVDSDDYLDNDYLDTMCKHAINYNCDIVSCSNKLVDEKNSVLDPHNNFKSDIFFTPQAALCNMYGNINYSFYSCCRLYRCNLFVDVLFDEKIKIYEDIGLLYKLFHKARKVSFIKYSGYNYFMNSDSLLHKKICNESILSIFESYLVSYEFSYNLFKQKDIKHLKHKIMKEFGRIYITFMHSYDFKRETIDEHLKFNSIKKRINIKKSILISNVFSLKGFLKKCCFIIFGSRIYSKL